MINEQVSKAFDQFLVQLHDTQRVLELAREKTPEAIKSLSDVIIEALDCELSPREADLAADVLINLAKRLEVSIRAGLALRLSVYENVPLRLALHLANDVADVATPFLENSPALSDTDLYYIIQGQESAHWQAIARRETLAPEIINLLVGKKDIATSGALILNTKLSFSDGTISALKDFVAENTDLIKDFASRADVPESSMLELYWKVNEAERKVIVDIAGIDVEQVDKQMQDTAVDFTNVLFGALEITEEMQNVAKRMQDKGALTTKKMLKALQSGQIGLFYSMFAAYSSVPIEAINNIFMEDKGKALAIVSRALDIDRSVFISFFVHAKKLRHEDKIDHDNLNQAMRYFNSLKAETAKSLLPSVVKQFSFGPRAEA